MTTIHALTLHIKHHLGDLGLVVFVSFITNFWNALEIELGKELNISLLAHAIVVLIIALILKLVGRWIGEEIDELSDMEFMSRYECQYNVFEKLTDIRTHGLLYTPNYDYDIYDRNKIKVYSNVLGIHSTETFEFTHTAKIVSLKNIHGSYQSSVSYEWDGSGIVAQWIVKPKGFRRAFALVFGKKAAKDIKADFQKFVDKNKL